MSVSSLPVESPKDRLARRWKHFQNLLRWGLRRRVSIPGHPICPERRTQIVDDLMGDLGARLTEAIDDLHELTDREWSERALDMASGVCARWCGRQKTHKARTEAKVVTTTIFRVSNDPCSRVIAMERVTLVRRALTKLSKSDRWEIRALASSSGRATDSTRQNGLTRSRADRDRLRQRKLAKWMRCDSPSVLRND